MLTRQLTSSDATNRASVHPDLRDALAFQEGHHRVPVLSDSGRSWQPGRRPIPGVVEEEQVHPMAQPEIQPIRLVDHCLVVPGIRIAPNDSRTREVHCPRTGRPLQWGVLFGLLLLRWTIPAVARDEHAIDLVPARGGDPTSLASIAHLQLRPQLVQGAHGGLAHEPRHGGEATLRRMPELVEYAEQLGQLGERLYGIVGVAREFHTFQALGVRVLSRAVRLRPQPLEHRHNVACRAELAGTFSDQPNARQLHPLVDLLHQDLHLGLQHVQAHLVLRHLHLEAVRQAVDHGRSPIDPVASHAPVDGVAPVGSVLREGKELPQKMRILPRHLRPERRLGVPLEQLYGSWEQQGPRNKPREGPHDD
mmetsp:Transcript_133552/g.386589  ORF Transcript_133552/g.386589 Transcript_133552/m.386589 type:complete len:364 (+) Transcript_133552:1303-2394(+)